jgi:hypothetical protein
MKKTLIALFAVIVIVFSCSKTNLHMQEIALLRVKTPAALQTKSAIQGDQFPVGSKMGIQLLKLEDNTIYSQSGITNNEYTYAGLNEWTSASSYILSSQKAKVYAYYPFTALGGNNQIFFSVPISVDPAGNTADYMYATPVVTEETAVSNTRSTINLTMNHALAQVSVLVFKENYNGTGELTGFSLEDNDASSHLIVNKETDNDLSMSIIDGAITGGTKGKVAITLAEAKILQNSSSDPIFPSTDISTLKTQVNTYGVNAIVVPTGDILPGELKFSFVIDGNTYSISNGTPIKFEKGKQYIYKVKLAGTSLTVSSVTITDWLPVEADDMVIQ